MARSRSRNGRKSPKRKSPRSRSRSRKGKKSPRRGSRKGSRRGVAKGCGALSMGACNDKFTNGLRACRWSYSKLKCEGIPAKYRRGATLGVGGSATYKKHKAGARRKLSAARLSQFSSTGGRMHGPYGGFKPAGKKLGKERFAMFETKSEAVAAAKQTPTASDIIVSKDAPQAPPMYGFFY